MTFLGASDHARGGACSFRAEVPYEETGPERKGMYAQIIEACVPRKKKHTCAIFGLLPLECAHVTTNTRPSEGVLRGRCPTLFWLSQEMSEKRGHVQEYLLPCRAVAFPVPLYIASRSSLHDQLKQSLSLT